MIGYSFGASFKRFSLSFPDVSKNKGMADTAPLKHGSPLSLISLSVGEECATLSSRYCTTEDSCEPFGGRRVDLLDPVDCLTGQICCQAGDHPIGGKKETEDTVNVALSV